MPEIKSATHETWEEARAAIMAGMLVVFPTDTVYGIGCSAHNPQAINSIYDAKGREHQKAIPLLLSGPDRLADVATSVPESARKLADRFWPAALTLVVPQTADLPTELGGGSTIAVRVPDHNDLRDFIERCGGILAVTSANASGQPDALDAQAAAAYFTGVASVALVVDGGVTRGSVPSTVVDCTVDPVRILRVGAIDPEQINRALYENADS